MTRFQQWDRGVFTQDIGLFTVKGEKVIITLIVGDYCSVKLVNHPDLTLGGVPLAYLERVND